VRHPSVSTIGIGCLAAVVVTGCGSPTGTSSPGPTLNSSATLSPARNIAGTWVSGPITFMVDLFGPGSCDVETDEYASSTWVISADPTLPSQVVIAVTLGAGKILSQSNPGCLSGDIFLNPPDTPEAGTISSTNLALTWSGGHPIGNCTFTTDLMSCTTREIAPADNPSLPDFHTAPSGIKLTRQHT
jgi:hypothetical protein